MPTYRLRTTYIPFSAASGDGFHLSHYLENRVRVFSIFGEFGEQRIPVSPRVQRSHQEFLPHFNRFRESVVSCSAEVVPGDAAWLRAYASLAVSSTSYSFGAFRSCIVDCSALSASGDIVALAFGDGEIEISHVELGESSRFLFQPHAPPLWMDFIFNDSHIILEDSRNILWLVDLSQYAPVKVTSDPLPSCRSVVRAMDSRRQMIIRAPRSDGSYHWSEQMCLIYIGGPDVRVRHLDSPEPHGPRANRNKKWPYSQSVGFSPNAVHAGAFDDTELYVWSTETFSIVTRDYAPSIEPEEETDLPSTTWILNRGIPNDSPICDFLRPSKTTTALIQYKEKDPFYDSFEMGKEGSTCDVDLPSLDLQSAAFIRRTLEQGWSRDEITRFYQEGCNPYVDRGHELRLGKHVIFSVMTTFMPLKLCDIERFDRDHEEGLCDDISKFWWIETVQQYETCSFVSHSADGKRVLLKGKAFAPVLVDISGFLSSPLVPDWD